LILICWEFNSYRNSAALSTFIRGSPILPALDGLQGSLAVTGITLHSTADFPPSCGKLFTTHSAVLGSFHWAGRTAFKMREPASFVNISPAPVPNLVRRRS